MGEYDLSFVNCPSCGSLIPSTAIRCRMCGFDMSQSRELAVEEDSSVRQGRITQKTLSLTKEEVDEMKKTSSSVGSVPLEQKIGEIGGASSVSEGTPSVKYQKGAEPVSEHGSSEEVVADDGRGFRFRGREKDPVSDENTQANSVSDRHDISERGQQRSSVTLDEQDRSSDRLHSRESDSPVVGRGQSRSDSVNGSNAARREPELAQERQHRQEARRENQREHGGREERNQERGRPDRGVARSGERSGKNDVESAGSIAPESVSQGTRGGQNFGGSHAPRHSSSPQGSSPQGSSPQNHSSHRDRNVMRDSDPRAQRRAPEQVTQGQGAPRQGVEQNVQKSDRADNSIQNVKVNKGSLTMTMQGGVDSNSGMLAAWFLHYQGDKVESIEIHEGRFLISGAKLRETDLVISDPSVTTPHAIVNSIPGSLLIVDLMSEKGTFVKYADQSDFVQITEQAALAHGDCVRFGDYEILVCVVPKFGS